MHGWVRCEWKAKNTGWSSHTTEQQCLSPLRGLGFLTTNLLRRRGLLFLLRHDDGRNAREGSLANQCDQHSGTKISTGKEHQNEEGKWGEEGKNVSAKESGSPRRASNGTR